MNIDREDMKSIETVKLLKYSFIIEENKIVSIK